MPMMASQTIKKGFKMKQTKRKKPIFTVAERLPDSDTFETFACFSTHEKADKCRMIYAKQYPDNDYTTDVLFLDNEYFLD